ncbi:rhodanese-like domain-containing protein [Planococcus sp. ISL-109]|uniref:rhodanese-like domain-containing protein n=1 Tax=Planococcus sp. ISL-109 TaxID=2819166 RepID=UPI001BE87A48|nr:rhodanese-like domain-containing protein [Planococcus sp. ISL-109]MBT2581979.1 rhodanese-like domain-containing protein [Planococcus sp. ISL-109]
MKTVTADELKQKVEAGETVHIIDVREKDEVAAGMIPGAQHIPLGELPERTGELDSSQEYYVVCHAGGRSAKASEHLESNGFHPINVEGGMSSWRGVTVYG